MITFSWPPAGILSYGAAGEFRRDPEAFWFYGVVPTGQGPKRRRRLGTSGGYFMNEELSILLLIAQRLDQNKIDYMISGSMAANYYTIPRMTRDIDVVIELKRSEIDRFVKAFEVDFWVDAEMVEQETRQRGMFNLIHKEYVIKIDFILSKEQKFQEAAFERRKNIIIEGQPVWFISAEDLVLAKLLWAKDSFSELQLNDVRNLLQTVDGLDRTYLDKWVKELGLDVIYKKIKL